MSEREISCPACGAAMERKLENFTIGTDGGGGLFSSLLHDQYDVDLYACPRCGKVELYTANFQITGEEPEGDPESSESAAEPGESAEVPEPPEEPGSGGGGLFGFGRSREKRPPWEK